MEVYKRETKEILKRYAERKISHQECIAALDAVLNGLISTLTPSDIPLLRGDA